MHICVYFCRSGLRFCSLSVRFHLLCVILNLSVCAIVKKENCNMLNYGRIIMSDKVWFVVVMS